MLRCGGAGGNWLEPARAAAAEARRRPQWCSHSDSLARQGEGNINQAAVPHVTSSHPQRSRVTNHPVASMDSRQQTLLVVSGRRKYGLSNILYVPRCSSALYHPTMSSLPPVLSCHCCGLLPSVVSLPCHFRSDTVTALFCVQAAPVREFHVKLKYFMHIVTRTVRGRIHFVGCLNIQVLHTPPITYIFYLFMI